MSGSDCKKSLISGKNMRVDKIHLCKNQRMCDMQKTPEIVCSPRRISFKFCMCVCMLGPLLFVIDFNDLSYGSLCQGWLLVTQTLHYWLKSYC